MSDAQADALPAIPANRNWLGNQLIYWGLIRFPLWQSFAAVRVQTIGRIPLPHAGALICYMNHPAWWDGYMCAIINRMLLHRGGKHYVMMEEQQLRAYRFLTWAGVFSVHRQKPREAIRAIRYSSRKLQEAAGETLFIFPQGEITPNDQRPLRLFPGLVHIVRHMGTATLAPVALRYEFRGEQRPDIFIRFGPLHTVQTPLDVRQVQAELTTRLTASVESLREAVVADDTHQFRVLLRGSPSINTVFDQMVRLLR